MNFLLKRNKVHITIVLTIISSLLILHITKAVTAEPGTPEDPIVSQSYVDNKLEAINNELAALKQQAAGSQTGSLPQASDLSSKINSLENELNSLKQQIQSGQPVQSQDQKFEVIGPIQPGKLIIAGESTEIVLRSGTATAIASEKGGIIDLITGADLSTGDIVTQNHLMLVPRNDGRGITITGNKDAWILIKGSYTIR